MFGSGVKPPLVAKGADNYGGVIVVVSFTLMVVTVLFACMRVYNTIARKKGFGFDDLTFYMALAIIVPHTVAVRKAVDHGLGMHIAALSTYNISQFFKVETTCYEGLDFVQLTNSQWVYINQLLSILCQCFAKFSVIFLVIRLDTRPSTWIWSRVLSAAIVIWTVFSVFTIAFQCGFPDPWIQSHDRCAAHGSLYYAIISLNIATDGFLAFFFIPAIWKLQMRAMTKRTVTLLFASRLSFSIQEDKSWDLIIPIVLDELIVNLSVITAGIPPVHRFLTNLQSGQFGAHMTDHELSGGHRGSVLTPSQTCNPCSQVRRLPPSRVQCVANTIRDLRPRWYRRLPQPEPRPTRAPEDEEPLRLTPEPRNEISTTIYANKGETCDFPEHVQEGRDGADVARDESRRSRPLSTSGVMQRTELSISVEYVKSEHSSRLHDP
ncbi:hypothetical protein EJ05DRAFT_482769 [Pseudovirgaria hyperparasitica]|uniref:Rhodopsin domain-containing protein n=1 Tax=Pseudovirgaria hyperparasitica TaxID=470096 RepID=A0A6A6WIR5_9PEZI|nr:uncharacterized protein EJ05DRAFT_482769 [Pseudovirgaria hyperparasitica]KAF2761966.1 hypothetical protein EJ05DRAFT_482769 [Pseudovirgaria hyperparasitica]